MKSSINVVILAAGLGTRMKSKRAKVLHRAGGLTLIEHVVQTSIAITPPEHVTVVEGHQAEQVKAVLASRDVRFVEQAEQKGTGHAVMMCQASRASEEGFVVVLYGDCPLLSHATLK
jgi:bifunctional UDP-N-acetylglucosamine pyrophosphorylase/glucosamine-1-phosphate N-acetyltransferase